VATVRDHHRSGRRRRHGRAAERRYGYEVNVTYEIDRHLEFNGSYSGDHTRFTGPRRRTGHLGDYITDAPAATGSMALYLKDSVLERRYECPISELPALIGACVNSAAVHDFPGVATSCVNAPTALGRSMQGFAK